MIEFEPEDDEDASFHERFGGLRRQVIRVADGLARRVKGRVAEVERTSPRMSDAMLSGLAEMLNVFARILGGDDSEDSDDG